MTDEVKPPDVPAPPSQALQLAKLVIGAVLTLAFLAALALERQLGGLDPTTRVALIAALAGSITVGTHGAYKMTPGGGQ